MSKHSNVASSVVIMSRSAMLSDGKKLADPPLLPAVTDQLTACLRFCVKRLIVRDYQRH